MLQAPLGFRMPPSIPRIVSAVALGALLLERRRRTLTPQQQTAQHPDRASYRAHASGAVAVPVPVVAVPGGVLALLRTVRVLCVQMLSKVWLTVALAAATSVTTQLSQLQLADVHKAVPKEAIDLSTVEQLSGQWFKVPAQSDPMDSFCELFGVPRWLRQATRLMYALELSIVDDALVVKQLCRISWLSTTERFPLDGSRSGPHKRRDMRSGKQVGQVLSAHDGVLRLQVQFLNGLLGSATDTLRLQEAPHGRELHVFHEAFLAGRGEARFKEVYRMG